MPAATTTSRSSATSAPRGALEFLLEHSPPQGVSSFVQLCLCILLFILAINWAATREVYGLPSFILVIEYITTGILPFLYGMESRRLAIGRRDRFLESTLLTSLSAREWSDGLLLYGMRKVVPTLIKVYVFLLGLTLLLGSHILGWQPVNFDDHSFVRTLLWLPTSLCLICLMAYFHQLRAALDVARPGREMAQVVLCVPLFGLSLILFDTWIDAANPIKCMALIILTISILVALRSFIHYRIRGLNQASPKKMSTNPAMRAWSHNLIVLRESWRAARRGGRTGLYLRRSAVFVLFTGVMAYLVNDVGIGLGPWYIYYEACANSILEVLRSYTVVGVLLVYWSTLTAVFDERHHETALLLESTPMTVRDYRSGWVDWATRYRNLELMALYTVAGIGLVGCLWAESGWNLARWAPQLVSTQWLKVEDAVGIGLVSWIWMQCMAHVALLASARSRSWLAMQLDGVKWVVPYLLVNGLVSSLVWLTMGNMAGNMCSVIISLAFYRQARRLAQAALEEEGGGLRLVP